MMTETRKCEGMPRISLIYGTKAQFIKMMPVVWELERREIRYRVIETGQHESVSADLRQEYGIRPPDQQLGFRFSNVNTVGRGIAWLMSNFYRYAVWGKRTREELFDGREDIALVHGDTASTVLAAVIAKRAGQRVMHIEAGLRSWRVLNPFPEELVRILVMRMSDYLIAPSSQAYENLAAMSLEGRCWHVGGNTGMDVLAADMRKKHDMLPELTESYCVVTIHRMETLYKRGRLRLVVDTVVRAQKKTSVLFVQHAPTARRLAAYGMLEELEQAGVRMLDLMNHAGFVHLLKGARYVVTDGGSVQEECGYLGTPCLLMRMATERPDGLDANVVLSEMDSVRIGSFLENYERYRRPPVDFDQVRPSVEIVDIIESVL